MLNLKNAIALVFVGLVALLSGCSGGDSSDLASQLATLRTATAHFESVLAQVQDEASAKELLPELNIAIDQMTIAMSAVQNGAKRTSQTDIQLRKEIAEFQANGNTIIMQELDRLKRISGVPKALESMLKKLQ